ncbi:WecB/TagA/CpsF family glycosyltransferase [Acidobacteriota bacterium]
MDSVEILGVRIDRVDLEASLHVIDDLIRKDGSHQVCVPNVWSTVLMQKDQDFKSINNRSSMAIPDGMPLVWVSRLYGQPVPERVTGADLFFGCARLSEEKGYRIFLLGSTNEVLDAMSQNLIKEYPELNIAGIYSPPYKDRFSEEDNQLMIRTIHAAQPDVLWVGLTAPKQEKWIRDNLDRLEVPVAIGVGAVFDFVAGKVKRAPSWMQRLGLEWLHRFNHEPRRLWRRYLIGNTQFIWLVSHEFFRKRRARPGS